MILLYIYVQIQQTINKKLFLSYTIENIGNSNELTILKNTNATNEQQQKSRKDKDGLLCLLPYTLVSIYMFRFISYTSFLHLT